MNQVVDIPFGFKQDAKGRLIPEAQIKPIELERDDLTKDLIEEAKALQIQMQAFKRKAFADVAAFIQLSAEQYDIQLGGNKGNVTLLSFDGTYKIVRQNQDSIRFDERLAAAKALIDDCIQSWSEGSNSYIKILVNDAFQVDKEGKISTGRVLSLRRHDIQDERWQKAMQAISDSIMVTDSKNYIRFYERDNNGKYQPISLDFANI
ncbi:MULTISPECIES: DUF3164 family protein [Acinetobacter]|uniref:DUF3164 family protein n=1 Tax=Acinetobacter TaxID=469 RepID=UPI0018A2DE5E|nr:MULTISPECIES: DUF3164 family protein [Acinetobacter]MBF7689602.1 DUF3164 family protein [Acinetobacter pollinis]MBF7698221.1 DUF3164 family protein [Acinetobacter pollinis]MCF8999267.1 DUF3164 family protein [Acinetobacter nectaris]MCF9028126.1 DUF3164 family protein [Acinetobacter nectaris]